MMRSLQCRYSCHVSTPAAMTAANGTTVNVPVRKRSSASFSTGSTSSRLATAVMLGAPPTSVRTVCRVDGSGSVEHSLQGKYPPDDRKRRGVGGIHAVVGQPAGAQRARLGVRGVGGVVD